MPFSVPDVPIFYPGIPPSIADELNAGIRDPFTNLLGKTIFRARRTTALAVAESTHQYVTWNQIDEDPSTGWSAGTPTRYTAQVDGWYLVVGTVSLSNTGAANLVLIPAVAVNGASPTGFGAAGWEGPELRVPTGGTGEPKICQGTWEVYARAGDYIELDLWYSTESAITAVDITAGQQCRIDIVWMGM